MWLMTEKQIKTMWKALGLINEIEAIKNDVKNNSNFINEEIIQSIFDDINCRCFGENLDVCNAKIAEREHHITFKIGNDNYSIILIKHHHYYDEPEEE